VIVEPEEVQETVRRAKEFLAAARQFLASQLGPQPDTDRVTAELPATEATGMSKPEPDTER
jgi:hypothetical protein